MASENKKMAQTLESDYLGLDPLLVSYKNLDQSISPVWEYENNSIYLPGWMEHSVIHLKCSE